MTERAGRKWYRWSKRFAWASGALLVLIGFGSLGPLHFATYGVQGAVPSAPDLAGPALIVSVISLLVSLVGTVSTLILGLRADRREELKLELERARARAAGSGGPSHTP